MSANPLVSIICLVHQQAEFVEACLRSVAVQSYANIELIIVEDASSDQSGDKIRRFLQKNEEELQGKKVLFIQNTENLGNCRSFNLALKQASGKYVIDLAADDVLTEDSIALRTACFEQLPEHYALVFANAWLMDRGGRIIGSHHPTDQAGRSREKVPSGFLFEQILRCYFICVPSMMFRKSVLDQTGGYDENLSYEDFDFWVRTSRLYAYQYLDCPVVMKRLHPGSHSSGFYSPGHPHLYSTLKICEKAASLAETPSEKEALAVCLRYHLRQSFYMQTFELTQSYGRMLEKEGKADLLSRLIVQMSRLKIRVFPLYQLYLKALKSLKKSR